MISAESKRRTSALTFLLVCAIITVSPLMLASDDIDEQYDRASDLLWKGDLNAAQTELRAILKLKPDYDRAKILLGLTLVRLAERSEKEGDRSTAAARLREAISFDPDEAYAHAALAWVLHAQGATEEATKECSRAATLSPDDSDLARGCGFGATPKLVDETSIPYWQGLKREVKSAPPLPASKPDPPYSEKARLARHQGRLVIWIIVGVHGDVEEAAIAEPLGLGLDQRALQTVRTWKFRPASLNGTPIPVRLKVEISFRLF